MKKIIKLTAFLLSLLIIVCGFAGCGKQGKTVEDIKKAGELVIATSPDFPPFESLNSDGSITGIEIDIMEKICAELGVKLKIESMTFDSVLPGIKAQKYDVGVSGITVTEKRQKNALFTVPYCLAAQSIVVKEGSPIKSKADLAGKKVSVQTGTTAETFCMEAGYTVSAFEANVDAQGALFRSGDAAVDAWVIDDLTASDMVAEYNSEHSDEKLVILDDPMTTEPYAFAFSLGSDELVNKVNEILNKMIKSGDVKEIFEKYNAPYTSPEK